MRIELIILLSVWIPAILPSLMTRQVVHMYVPLSQNCIICYRPVLHGWDDNTAWFIAIVTADLYTGTSFGTNDCIEYCLYLCLMVFDHD